MCMCVHEGVRVFIYMWGEGERGRERASLDLIWSLFHVDLVGLFFILRGRTLWIESKGFCNSAIFTPGCMCSSLPFAVLLLSASINVLQELWVSYIFLYTYRGVIHARQPIAHQ